MRLDFGNVVGFLGRSLSAKSAPRWGRTKHNP